MCEFNTLDNKDVLCFNHFYGGQPYMIISIFIIILILFILFVVVGSCGPGQSPEPGGHAANPY
jgi:hypothetical protein